MHSSPTSWRDVGKLGSLRLGANLCDRPQNASWEPGRYLPDGRELAAALVARYPWLAANYSRVQSQDLARVAQYITALVGKGPLYNTLHQVFDADYPPTSLHRFLAGLSRRTRLDKGQCLLVVTMNYDTALEKAFEELGGTVRTGDVHRRRGAPRQVQALPLGRKGVGDRETKQVHPSAGEMCDHCQDSRCRPQEKPAAGKLCDH